MNDHRWNTEEYERRTRELYRTELHKLYPSEAWALYRTLPLCSSVIDLGCGNGAMGSVVQKISPKTKYTGMDHQENLMNEAGNLFPFADYFSQDLTEFLKIAPCKSHDCVMSWSVIKSFGNWREIISKMTDMARKYVIFDIRVVNCDKEIFDENVCWAEYGGRRGPILYVNYDRFKEGVLSSLFGIRKVEFCGYRSDWGQFVEIDEAFKSETFLITTVVTKGSDDHRGKVEVFEQLPIGLKRT